MNKEEQLKYYLVQFDASIRILEKDHNVRISRIELTELLSIHFGLYLQIIHSELIRRKITANEIVKIILKEKKYKLAEILTKDIELPAEVLDCLTKAQVKMKGVKWTIHKYDKDPFPSNPHAHICDENLKIHLGNGQFYRNKIRLTKKLRRKDLILLRKLIQGAIPDIILPELITQ
jgi:hypothetical protein